MKPSILAIAAVMLACGAPSARAGDVIMSGGENGDYFQYFSPPLQKILAKAWVDAPIQASAGTPENLDYVVAHQTSYALAQGNVYAALATDPKYAGKLKELSAAVGNEAVLAIVGAKTFERSKGSFTAIAQHAGAVRFALAPANSGPGFTFKQLQALDPDGLGNATRIDTFQSLDAAIEAVGKGDDDVTLMVQFANPDNARFRKVSKLRLHFVGIVLPAMRTLMLPSGKNAFNFCPDLDVGGGQTVSTACSPILAVTGAENSNPDLATVFASVTAADFAPVDSGFAKLWKKMKTAGKVGWDAAVTKADELAKKASDSM